MKEKTTRKKWQTPKIILFDQDQVTTGKFCIGSEGGKTGIAFFNTVCLDTTGGGRASVKIGSGIAPSSQNNACSSNRASGPCVVS